MPAEPAATRRQPPVPPHGSRLDGVALGIDVGGTGVKAALVDLATATLVSTRIRDKTPHPADPDAVVEVMRSVVARTLEGHEIPDFLPTGCGLPGVVKEGRLTTAANIDPQWVGWPAQERIGAAIGHPAMIINDADAAGLAEVAYGAAEGIRGTVQLLTIGTGIGSALFIDGQLVPNTEFGHIEMRGRDAESRVSGAARERRKLGWKAWAREFDEYLSRLELYLGPDLFILGGGVSKDWARFGKYLSRPTPIVTATFLNASGIIGAAYAAAFTWRRNRAGTGDGVDPYGLSDAPAPRDQLADGASPSRPAGYTDEAAKAAAHSGSGSSKRA